MTRALSIAMIIALLAPSIADAQPARPPRANARGVELALDGALAAPRGGRLRWLMTAYEVLGLEDLRPAPGAQVSVTTSLEGGGDPVTATTDAGGRAAIELAVPADADGFRAVVRVVASSGVQRRFELDVEVTPRESVAVRLAQRRIAPGGELRAFGRLIDTGSGRPIGGARVELFARDEAERPLAPSRELTTDAAGMFAAVIRVPRDARGAITVEARAGEAPHVVRATDGGEIQPPQGGGLLVAVAPASRLARPGTRLGVDVMVRTPEGRPVPEARLVLEGSEPRDRDGRAVTDARGRARLAWAVPELTGTIQDARIVVRAAREGLGEAEGYADVRIAGRRYAAALAVENGALVPALGGRVFVRVVGADGHRAAAGVPVRVRGVRLAASGVQGTTDADGVAVLEVTLRAASSADRCGGETATALDVEVDGEVVRAACLPLDPDGAARVRLASSMVVAGSNVRVELARVPAARSAEVLVELFATRAGRVAALGQTVVAAAADTAELPVPADAAGTLWVRARPWIGAARQPVRGSVAAAWIVPELPSAVSVRLDGAARTAQVELAAGAARSAYVVALPVDAARQLALELRASVESPLTGVGVEAHEVQGALLAAALAAMTPLDVGAPFVLRERAVVDVPAPEGPERLGLLRDPWRSRARFVSGRLAMIYHAIEAYVSGALPDRVDDVAVRRGNAWDFNAQILESVAASSALGRGGATGLGGEPLTIQDLRTFDRSLTYDAVARRITRQRLYRLVVSLREFVHQQGFDLAWSRLGNPAEWLPRLVDRHAAGQYVQRTDLVDGWGRPFELRPARGGRARFAFLSPLGTFEIVSAGPDGTQGSGDDFWDPTARVVPTGTPYAVAVAEDVLVARLQGVELGRAGIELAHSVDQPGYVGGVPGGRGQAALGGQLWGEVPSPLAPPDDPLALRRPARPSDGAGGALHRAGGPLEVALPLGDEPRTWGVVALAASDAGGFGLGFASAIAGSSLILEGGLPRRVRAGEPVTSELVITNVGDAARELTVVASADGLGLGAPPSLTIPPGESRPMQVRIEPREVGTVRASLVLSDESERRELGARVETVGGGHPLRLRAAGRVAGQPWSTQLQLPPDARRPTGRLVLMGPSALAADPDLADLRRHDPALVAWSDALAGRRSDPRVWSDLLRAQQPDTSVRGDDSWLSTACALVAWSAADETDTDAQMAAARVRAAAGGAAGEASSLEPRRAAAILAALSPAGVPDVIGDESGDDPVIAVTTALQRGLRRALRTHPEDPSVLARAAAALLLADPGDAHGLAMLDRAEQATAPHGPGVRVRPTEAYDGDAIEPVAASLALAIAAHQADRTELAARLLASALADEHAVLRRGGEAAFWHLAAAAFGAMGETPERVTVVVDGAVREVTLERGFAAIELPVRAGATTTVIVRPPAHAALVVRAEAVMERPFAAREGGPLTLAIAGDVGDTRSLAALELTVHANARVDRPTVDLELPTGVEGDEALLAAIGGTDGVAEVRARHPGMLRLELTPMAQGTDRTIPLPLRWTVTGALRGLAAVAYPRAEPAAMTVLPPRRLDVR